MLFPFAPKLMPLYAVPSASSKTISSEPSCPRGGAVTGGTGEGSWDRDPERDMLAPPPEAAATEAAMAGEMAAAGPTLTGPVAGAAIFWGVFALLSYELKRGGDEVGDDEGNSM